MAAFSAWKTTLARIPKGYMGRRLISLTAELKEYAIKRGIELIGVTFADAFEVEGREEPLVNPRTYLENAKSVVVFGYYLFDGQPLKPSSPGVPRGRIVPDIRVFPAMDEYCCEVIKGYLIRKGHNAVAGDDKIALKPLVVKAGIGLYGKNSIVHAEGFGSRIVIGAVITDASLEAENHPYKSSDCGDCTACMEACPTGALGEPYRLKQSLCITEWLDGAPIPYELQEKVGNRLRGCEICQEVCPKNRGLVPRKYYPVKVEEKSDSPELIPLLLGDEDYLKKVLPNFVLTDVATLKRNVALALGNVRDPVAVPALIRAISYSEPEVRSYAAWALGRIGGKKAREALARSLNSEVNLEVQEQIKAALQECSKV